MRCLTLNAITFGCIGIMVSRDTFCTMHPSGQALCEPGSELVLSPSSERTDRTRKMRDYLALPTVEEYLLVDSRAYRVEMYRREGQKWVYYVFGFEDELELVSIDLRFPVAAAYTKIQLAPEDMEDEAD